MITMKTRALAALGCLALASCGGAALDPKSSSTLSGLVSAAAPVGSVTLKDSSVPPQERTSTTDANGAFSFDVKGLTPPFFLTAVDASGKRQSAIAMSAGVTKIDDLTTAAYTESSTTSGEEDPDRYESNLGNLRLVLAPLFAHYGVTFGDDATESKAFETMLSQVSFSFSSGTFTVTNKATGGIIYSAPLSNLASGVFHPENIPSGGTPPPATTCSSFTYSAWGACSSSGTQTRTVVMSSPAGCTGGNPVLKQTCTPSPAVTCTAFTYNAWTPAVCPANGMQSRTVATSSPTGCTGGSPVLTQSCTPPPPAIDGTALYNQYCSGCHGNSKKGRPASATQAAINSNTGGMGTPALMALTPAQLQAIATAP